MLIESVFTVTKSSYNDGVCGTFTAPVLSGVSKETLHRLDENKTNMLQQLERILLNVYELSMDT
jgi:hypothetical protein